MVDSFVWIRVTTIWIIFQTDYWCWKQREAFYYRVCEFLEDRKSLAAGHCGFETTNIHLVCGPIAYICTCSFDVSCIILDSGFFDSMYANLLWLASASLIIIVLIQNDEGFAFVCLTLVTIFVVRAIQYWFRRLQFFFKCCLTDCPTNALSSTGRYWMEDSISAFQFSIVVIFWEVKFKPLFSNFGSWSVRFSLEWFWMKSSTISGS